MSKTPRTDALVLKHQAELNATRASDDPMPILRLAQTQAIESVGLARQLESENAEMAELLKRIVHGGRASISILEEARALLAKVEGK